MDIDLDDIEMIGTEKKMKKPPRNLTLPQAYGKGLEHLARFLGKTVFTATVTALTFAWVYKYVVVRDDQKKELGQ